MTEERDIKTMKLYHHFERVDNELRHAGFKDDDKLRPEDLFAFDNMNYYGTEAVQNAIDCCKIDQNCKVLDIGSGLGGPARFMASKTGCEVFALELQEDCSRKAFEYTERCTMTENIHHITDDFLRCDLEHTGTRAIDTSYVCTSFSFPR